MRHRRPLLPSPKTHFKGVSFEAYWRLAISVLVAAPAVASGQQLEAPEDETLIELQLAPNREVPEGVVAAAEGTVDAAGLRFILGGLSVVQPVTVTLVADDLSDDLGLELVKHSWTAPERSGSTRGNGYVQFRFHTEGFVKIGVRSRAGPRPFTLVAWAGEESVEVDDNVLVSPAESGSAGAGADRGSAKHGSATMERVPLVLVALLVGGVLVGLIIRQRRHHA